MDVDSDITKVNSAIDAFHAAETSDEKLARLCDFEKIIDVVFATSEVRDRLYRFTMDMVADKLLGLGDDEEAQGEPVARKAKVYLTPLNFIRKLQSKNFLSRRLQQSDWRILLQRCVIQSLTSSTDEEVWCGGLQLFMASDDAMRCALVPQLSFGSDQNTTYSSLMDRLGDLLAHPMPADRYSLLQRSEPICRHLLNLVITAVNTLQKIEAEEAALAPLDRPPAEGEEEAETSPSEGGERRIEAAVEKQARRRALVRLVFLIISSLTSHESELGRWSLLQTLEQMEGRLSGYSSGLNLPQSVIRECNIEKIGKDLQSLLRNWPLPTLRLWRVLVRLLDKCILTSTCFNALAPVIADSLSRLANSPRVQLLTQDAWTELVDIFTFYPGSRDSASRMCLLLRVYRRVYTHEVVQARRLLCWWHFITRLSSGMLLQMYETALTPFLAYALGGFPVDQSVPQAEAEKQFGYRLSSYHAASSVDCLYFASHVMAQIWLRQEDPDLAGQAMRQRLLQAVKPKTAPECNGKEEEERAAAGLQIYSEQLEDLPHDSLPLELFSKRPVLAERMVHFLQRWLHLWRREAIANGTDPANEILFWILSRALLKWLSLVSEASGLPTADKLVPQMIVLMVRTVSDACSSFNVDLCSRIECISAILARPVLLSCMTLKSPNFREWPAFLIFSLLMNFDQANVGEKAHSIFSSGIWSSLVEKLTKMLVASPLRSLDLFSAMAALLQQVVRSPWVNEPQTLAGLLTAWHIVATALTEHITQTHEVATGDLAVNPRLDAVECCLVLPFQVGTATTCELLAGVGPSSVEIGGALRALYDAFYPEALLLGPIVPNAWCSGVARHLLDFARLPQRSTASLLLGPALQLCLAMLDHADVSLAQQDSADGEENAQPGVASPDSSGSSVDVEGVPRTPPGPRVRRRRWHRPLFGSPSVRRTHLSLDGAGGAEPGKDGSSTGLFSPGQWSRERQRPLGNLTLTYEALLLLLKALPSAFGGMEMWGKEPLVGACLDEAGAEEVNRILTSVVRGMRQLLLEKIQRPAPFLVLMERSGPEIGDFVSWCTMLPSRTLRPALRQRIESVPTDLLDRAKVICPGPYDSKMLSQLSPLISCICELQLSSKCSPTTTASQRKAKRSLVAPLVSFWNATFAECQQLEYPKLLLGRLHNLKNRLRLPIYLPPNGASTPFVLECPSAEMELRRNSDSQVTSDSAVFTPPPMPSSTAPVNVVGSFLHRSPLPPPFSPIGPASLEAKPTVRKKVNRNSSAFGAGLNEEDSSSDKLIEHARQILGSEGPFVFVPTASVRLTRLRLTDHQKERMAELKQCEYLPAMYNGLDSSQSTQLGPGRHNGSLDGSQLSTQLLPDSEETREDEDVSLMAVVEEEEEEEEAYEEAIESKRLAEPTAKAVRPDEERKEEEEEEEVFHVEATQSPPPLAERIGLARPRVRSFEAAVADRPGPTTATDADSNTEATIPKSSSGSTINLVAEDDCVLPPDSDMPRHVGAESSDESQWSVAAVAASDHGSIGGSSPGAAEDEELFPAVCSTPVSTTPKMQRSVRLGVSVLAERLRPDRRKSVPSKLSTTLPLPLVRKAAAGGAKLAAKLANSRGARMVALAQASQAERREKARMERETGASTASDTSYSSSVGSKPSPPGIIRSFFTPSKGHRVSFADPLVSTWDGQSPRTTSASMCVEVGTPAAGGKEAEEGGGVAPDPQPPTCRKSLLSDFEEASGHWASSPPADASGVAETTGEIDVDLESDAEETHHDRTVAMVEGEGVCVEEFHAVEPIEPKDEVGTDKLHGFLSGESETEPEVIILDDDDDEEEEEEEEEDEVEELPPPAVTEDAGKAAEEAEVEEIGSSQADAGPDVDLDGAGRWQEEEEDDNEEPAAKRRRVEDTTESVLVEDTAESVLVEDTKAAEPRQEEPDVEVVEMSMRDPAENEDPQAPAAAETTLPFCPEPQDAEETEVPQTPSGPGDASQPIPVALVQFEDSQSPPPLSPGRLPSMFLDASETPATGADSPNSPDSPDGPAPASAGKDLLPLAKAQRHLAEVQAVLRQLSAPERVALARGLTAALQSCLAPEL